jgi:hypothetical protein
MYRRVLTTVNPSQRTYVGLAFNQQNKNEGIETVDRSLRSFQSIVNGPTDTISEVGKGKMTLLFKL